MSLSHYLDGVLFTTYPILIRYYGPGDIGNNILFENQYDGLYIQKVEVSDFFRSQDTVFKLLAGLKISFPYERSTGLNIFGLMGFDAAIE